jgi:hypothetical protein
VAAKPIEMRADISAALRPLWAVERTCHGSVSIGRS